MKVKYLFFALAMVSLPFMSCNNEGKNTDADTVEIDDSEVDPENVTDEQLQKFIDVMNATMPLNEAAQMSMIQAVQDAGMEVEQYMMISQITMDPESGETVSGEDLAAFEKVTAEIERIEQESKLEMEQMIEKSGMSLKRYESMMMAIQTNPDLLQRAFTMMGMDLGGEMEDPAMDVQ